MDQPQIAKLNLRFESQVLSSNQKALNLETKSPFPGALLLSRISARVVSDLLSGLLYIWRDQLGLWDA